MVCKCRGQPGPQDSQELTPGQASASQTHRLEGASFVLDRMGVPAAPALRQTSERVWGLSNRSGRLESSGVGLCGVTISQDHGPGSRCPRHKVW